MTIQKYFIQRYQQACSTPQFRLYTHLLDHKFNCFLEDSRQSVPVTEFDRTFWITPDIFIMPYRLVVEVDGSRHLKEFKELRDQRFDWACKKLHGRYPIRINLMDYPEKISNKTLKLWRLKIEDRIRNK